MCVTNIDALVKMRIVAAVARVMSFQGTWTVHYSLALTAPETVCVGALLEPFLDSTQY